MNEEKNNQTDQPSQRKEIIPTWIGIAVAFIVIGSILFLFCKFKKVTIDTAGTSQSAKVQIKEDGSIIQKTNDQNSDLKEVDVLMDCEIKNIDNLANSLNEDDLSDEELGL